jgi:lysyl oxidase-like protein 2/3/4
MISAYRWFCRNQPIIFSELYRYGLHKLIKPSNGLFAPEKTYYKPATDTVHQVSTPEMDASLERLAIDFFSVDGYTSRQLMPYPFEPFREALWTRYDALSVRSRLNQIEGSKQDKDLFETLMGTIGSCPGSDIGFVEPLRWFALGGHTIAGMFEVIETFKLGGGGQTSFARSIFGDYRGHVKFNTVVEKIEQTQNGVTVSIKAGQPLKAVSHHIPKHRLYSV